MPERTFLCALCGDVFKSERPEAEARAECQEIFGDVPDADSAIVCDACWQKIRPDQPAPPPPEKVQV